MPTEDARIVLEHLIMALTSRTEREAVQAAINILEGLENDEMDDTQKKIEKAYHEGVGDGINKAICKVFEEGVETPDRRHICISTSALHKIKEDK